MRPESRANRSASSAIEDCVAVETIESDASVAERAKLAEPGAIGATGAVGAIGAVSPVVSMAVTLASIDSAWMTTTDDVLKRLRVLASLDVGNKLNTRMHYVYRNAWVARLCRSVWHTESREHTVSYARAAVDGLSAIATRVAVDMQPVPNEVRTELIDAAMGAREGLARLARTYDDDVGVASALMSQSTRLAVLCRCIVA